LKTTHKRFTESSLKNWKEIKKSRSSLKIDQQKMYLLMKKYLFGKIFKKLLSYYGKHLKGHAYGRVKKLAGFICGILRSKKPHMAAIGSGLPQQITAYSKEKAAKEFVDNKWTDYQTHYLPYISELLSHLIGSLCSTADIKLVIDGTKMGNAHMALMVSLVYKGRGIPLLWLVEKKPKGHFTTERHVELVQATQTFLKDLIPSSHSITLLGDGEFDSTDLQMCCRSKGWNYVFRTACDTVMYEDNVRFQPKDLLPDPGQEFLFIPNVEFTENRLKDVQFVYWHKPTYEEPLFLVSNLEEPIDIVQAYTCRFSIECLFRDLKSTTFNIHKTRLKTAHAISNLIMIAAFAFSLLLKLALKHEHSPFRKFIHRLRPDKNIHSLIAYGIDLLDYLLEEDIEVCFSFQFSKNSS
jgi:hypothetical protein